jgi:hypothetical protein
MKEHNIDCMKHRKHTHISGVDVEMITAEKGSCIVTIKDAYFSRGVDVSGNRTDGYFLEFEEDVMPMVCNSTNRKRIANNLMIEKKITPLESRNIGNWIGLKINLKFDPNIKMMGKITGGIVVDSIRILPNLESGSANFDAVKKALQGGNYTIEQVKTKYNVSEAVQKLLENGK